MGKKVNGKAQEVKTEQAKVQTQEVKAVVKALDFLKRLNLAWVLERPIEAGDIGILNAKVNATEKGDEWASWIIPYQRIDGKPVPGIAWGVSAPVQGGYLVMRLLDSGEVKATLRVQANGKGVIAGEPAIVKALTARPDLPAWSDEDTAALL